MQTSTEWTTSLKEGYRSKTVQVGCCTIIVHRPELDDSTQGKRQKAVQGALAQFGRDIKA